MIQARHLGHRKNSLFYRVAALSGLGSFLVELHRKCTGSALKKY